MKKYLTEELAKLAQKTIYTQYNNPQKILSDFKSNIKGKVKSLHKRELTENEIQTYSLNIADDIFNNLNLISIEIITSRLSKEVIDKSNNEGILLLEYKDYFTKFAKEMVKQLLQAKYNNIKKQIKKVETKSKKK